MDITFFCMRQHQNPRSISGGLIHVCLISFDKWPRQCFLSRLNTAVEYFKTLVGNLDQFDPVRATSVFSKFKFQNCL